MAFIEPAELKSVIYDYQLQQITETDESIVEIAIATAIEEVRSYLTPNGQHQFRDGRLLYDTDAIFSAAGEARNALILSVTKTVCVWWITQLSNPDIIYERVKDRYDRVVSWLKKMQDGTVTINSLPQLDPEQNNIANAEPFMWGSREKFNHE
jgi:phage gp36-like protein